MPETLEAPIKTAEVAPAPPSKGDTSIHGFKSDAFSKLDSMVETPKEEKPKPVAKEPPKAPAKEPPKQEAPKEKVEPKKEEPKTEGEKAKEPVEPKPEEGKTTEPAKAKPTLGQYAREQEKLVKELRAENEKLKTTSAAQKIEDHPEFKKLSEERDSLAKKVQELDDEVKYTNYERSSEYREQYEKPYQRAVQDAISTISEFEVTNADGSTRAATDADFWAIAKASSHKEARALAEEMFGNPTDAAIALSLRKQVYDAHNKAEAAKQEYRTKGNEREKQMGEQRSKQQKALKEQWENLNKEAEKKYPDQFGKREGDETFNQKLDKGYERIKPAFEGKGNPALESMIYMKAGAYDAVKYDRDNLRMQLKEAEAKIAEYETSEPSTGSPAQETTPTKELSAFEKIDRLAK